MDVRLEQDGLGTVEVPREALWGAHTERARANFGVGGLTLGDLPSLVSAYAEVKRAAARANLALGTIPRATGEAIADAAGSVARGEHADAFPLPVLQGGGGTSTNMNLNEVLANLAEEALGGRRGDYALVHPLGHANLSQSTNDTYPTALSVAVVREGRSCADGLDRLRSAVDAAAARAGPLERLGRTCLQDAVPLSAAAGLRATASGLERTAGDLRTALDRLLSVPLGATAVGTGLGAPPGFTAAAVEALAEGTGLALMASPDPFDALRHADPFVAVASALGRAWTVAAQFAADLRLLSSGPVGGLGEAVLTPVQEGSSIMRGKVNPVLPELVVQVGYELSGAHTVVDRAAAGGELELNVMEPAIAASLLPALAKAGRTAHLFADRCIDGLGWDETRIAANLAGSLAARVGHVAGPGSVG
jgi:aspartate ammonia-lyase